MTEKSEKGEIAYELLADKYQSRNDIIMIGDKLFNELKKTKETSLQSLVAESSKISLNFTQGFSKTLESLCYVTDGEENSFVDPSTDITGRDSYGLSQHSSTPNKSEFKLCLNSEVIGHYNSNSRTQSQAPQDLNSYLRTNQSPENYNPNRAQNKSHKTVIGGGKENFPQNRVLSPSNREDYHPLHNKTYDDEDSNLLSFDLKDLGTQESNAASDLAQIVRTEPSRSYYHPSYNHSKTLNPYRRGGDLDDFDNSVDTSLRNRNSTSSVVIVKSPRKTQQVPGSFSRLTENYGAYRDESRGPSRSISPIRSDISQGATPKARLRKKTGFNVADKFEGVIDGIKHNSIEIADLTGAGNETFVCEIFF